MHSVSFPPTHTELNHAQTHQPHYDESPTPTTSNCASPEKLPPPLSLGSSGHFENELKAPQLSARNPEHYSPSTATSLFFQEARFSSPAAEPIKVPRPFLDDKPTSFSLGVASMGPNPPKRPNARSRSLSKNDGRRLSQWPLNQDDCSLALTLHENYATIASDSVEAAFWVSLAQHAVPYYLPVLCDVVKTGVPWKLMRREWVAILQRCEMGYETPVLGPSFEHSRPRRGTADKLRTKNHSFSNAPYLRQGKVRGIPNFGQTCFMNSVLQSLASLEPFLAYLERIHQVQQDRFVMTKVASLSATIADPSLALASSDCFAEQLLQLLLAVNGLETKANQNNNAQTCLKIDPRPLLKRIGKDHLQFQRTGEQQDAQEYLHALIGVVISEAHLDSVTAVSDHMLVTGTSSRNISEEPITVAVAGFEGHTDKYSFQLDQSTVSRGSGSSDVCLDRALSLSSLLERIDENQKAIKLSPATIFIETAVGSGSGSVSTTLEAESSSLRDRSSDEADDRRQLPEEKKQDDFEITIPLHVSDECTETLGCKSKAPLSGARRMQTEGSTFTVRESRWACQNQSKAMKIVQSTISSITPSPLSGWLGSTIRCCVCQHVKPIRNAPFLDIPLVPSSVPKFLARADQKGPAPSSSPFPSCSIEQCLAEFTSVERVQDVECRLCSIRAEVVELQEEALLLSGAIKSTEKRLKSKGRDPSTETASLKEELTKIQVQLVKLQTTDPDDDDLQPGCDKNGNEEGFLWGENIAREPSRLARCDAQKCLFLTRCPSILCCHIQRRYYDPYSNRMEKCVQHVQFEELLDLSPYCAYSAEARISWVAGSARHSYHAKNKKGRQILYRLESVIEHRGNSHGGHYVCYRRFGKSWFRISDNAVSHISWKEVRSCQAYMLFYEAI